MKNRILAFSLIIITLASSAIAQDFSGAKPVKGDFSTSVDPTGKVIMPALAYTFNGKSDFSSLADSAHHSIYDTSASVFKLTVRTYYSYDSGGLMIQRITKSPDKTGTWKNYSLDTLTYTGPLLMKIISQQWDSQLSDWKNALKYDYFYNASNTLTSVTISHWSTTSNEWRYSERTAYTYNSSKQVSEELQQVWNSNLNSWDDNSRSTNTYTNNKISGILTEQWNTATLSWANFTRSSLSYVSGLNTETVLEKYVQALSIWVNQTRDAYSYNANGKADTQITQVWDTDKWVNSIQYLNTYTGSDLTSILTKQWSSSTKDWVNEQQDENYFSQHEVFGTPDLSGSGLMIPNPMIKGSQVKFTGLAFNQKYKVLMLNMNGQTVMSTILKGDALFTVPGTIATGLYIIQMVESNGSAVARKIVITE